MKTATAVLAIALSFMLASAGVVAAESKVSPSDPGVGTGSLTSPPQQSASGPHTLLGATDVKNLSTGEEFATIDAAIDDAETLDGHVLKVQVSSHAEGIVTIHKRVTIQGGGGGGGCTITPTTDTGGSGDGRAWFLVTVSDVTFKDLTFDGQSGSGRKIYQALRFLEGGARVEDCAFVNIKYVKYIGMAVVGFKNTTVVDCSFSNVERIGVILFGTDVTAGTVSGITYTGKGHVDGLDYAIELGGGADHYVLRCRDRRDAHGQLPPWKHHGNRRGIRRRRCFSRYGP